MTVFYVLDTHIITKTCSFRAVKYAKIGNKSWEEEPKMVSNEVLKEFALFKDLDDSELTSIAALCHEKTRGKDEMCFAQGQKANELHLCRSGSVRIVVQVFEPRGMKATVHTAKSGEVFGWSALVEPKKYTAYAECVGRVEEICIKGTDLIKLFERNPHTGYVVMRNLSSVASSRLTETREKLTKEMAAAFNQEW